MTTEVVVVGAGPTGLLAALLLKQCGVDVRIIETRATPSTESRAFAIQARTMELFQQLDLVDRFLAAGIINPGVEFYVGGKLAGGLDFAKVQSPDTPFPYIFLLPQAKTEAILIEALSQLGVEVEREVTLTTFTQTPDLVTLQLNDNQTLSCLYLIGADGAHSTVRHTLKLNFSGGQYAQTFMLADCKVDWPFSHDRFRLFMHGSMVGLFLPLEGEGCSRVMANELVVKADTSTQPLALEELEATFAEAVGHPVKLSNAKWLTRYRVHHRIVDRYRVGRVFVAGDAAHIHSPAGGQGMNTGLQDVANLVWKLAAVLKGADASLLDTYQSERLPVGAQVVAVTDKMFANVATRTGFGAKLKDLIARPLLLLFSHLAWPQRFLFRHIAELDIRYPGSAFFSEKAKSLSGPKVGSRAPNAKLEADQDLFALFKGYHLTVLLLSPQALSQKAADSLKQSFAEEERLKVAVLTRLASPEVFKRYAPTSDQPMIYVIRPDGYVGFKQAGFNLAQTQAFLKRFVIPDAAQPNPG